MIGNYKRKNQGLGLIVLVSVMIITSIYTVTPVTAYIDLVVDGDTIIISTAEDYGTIVVQNNGNLTITSTNVNIYGGLVVKGNSFVKFNNLYFYCGINITENSFVGGGVDTSSLIDNFNLKNSTAILDKPTSSYYPAINGMNCSDSTVELNGFELGGVVTVTNSTLSGIIDYGSYTMDLNIYESSVQFNKSVSSYYPVIDGIECVNSIITLFGFDIYGYVEIKNSIADWRSLKSSYYPAINGMNCSDSTVELNGFELGGVVTVTNSTLSGIIDYGSYTMDLNIYKSSVQFNKSTSLYYPAINGMNCSDSTVELNGFELGGVVTVTNSTLSGIIDYGSYTMDLNIYKSSVQFNKSTSLYYPDISELTCNYSQVSLTGFDLLDKLICSNSIINLTSVEFHANLTFMYSNVTVIECSIDENVELVDSNFMIKDSEIYLGEFYFEKDTETQIINRGSVGYFYIWRDMNTSEIMLSTIISIPEDTISIIEWEKVTGLWSYEWIESEAKLELMNWGEDTYLATFMLPSEFYAQDSVSFRLKIYEESLVIWQSQTWTLPVGEMIPDINLISPGEYRLEGQYTVQWEITGGDLNPCSVDIHISNEISHFIIAESIYSNEYTFNTLDYPDGIYTLVISIGNFNQTSTEILIDNINDPPSLNIITPINFQSYSYYVPIEWNTFDLNPSDDLIFGIYYSTDNSSWILLVENYYGSSWTWNTSTVKTGSYFLKITASDGINITIRYVGPIILEKTNYNTQSTTSPDLFSSIVVFCLVTILLKRRKIN